MALVSFRTAVALLNPLLVSVNKIVYIIEISV